MKVAIFLANGFEEIEALTPVDVLRRAGITVDTVGIGCETAVGSHGIGVVCDMTDKECDFTEYCMIILPGGMPGATNLDASEFVDKAVKYAYDNGNRLAAICAAPLILGRRGMLSGRTAICYPGFEDELRGARISEHAIVTDGNITTAKGMGVALDFAKELLRLLKGEDTAKRISDSIYDRG